MEIFCTVQKKGWVVEGFLYNAKKMAGQWRFFVQCKKKLGSVIFLHRSQTTLLKKKGRLQ